MNDHSRGSTRQASLVNDAQHCNRLNEGVKVKKKKVEWGVKGKDKERGGKEEATCCFGRLQNKTLLKPRHENFILGWAQM
jgi:hypothetical protein